MGMGIGIGIDIGIGIGLVKGDIRILFANQPVKFRMLFVNPPHFWHHQTNTG